MNLFHTSILVDTKKEYTIQLTNILTPLLFNGLKALYDDAINISKGTNVLLIYQNLLRRIPKWSRDLLQKETQRIKTQSKCSSWFDDLIKAVIKSNILILRNSVLTTADIDKYYANINIEDFIHKCYIQCGRELFTCPYLMYHKQPPIEIKKNQRECCNLIKESIKEAIRKMLPIQEILNFYLNNNQPKDPQNINIDMSITEDNNSDNTENSYSDTDNTIYNEIDSINIPVVTSAINIVPNASNIVPNAINIAPSAINIVQSAHIIEKIDESPPINVELLENIEKNINNHTDTVGSKMFGDLSDSPDSVKVELNTRSLPNNVAELSSFNRKKLINLSVSHKKNNNSESSVPYSDTDNNVNYAGIFGN
jgi:hypothetical protein